MSGLRMTARPGSWTLIVLLTGCESAVAPREPTRLEEVRRVAPDGYGAFTGIVRGLHAPDSSFCGVSSPVLAGVRVDLGIWHDRAGTYRDTLTRSPPTSLKEKRFEVIGSTTTDGAGQFTFDHLPRRTAFAFRAIPPSGSPFKLVYGMSLYGIGNVEVPNHPSLCLPTR